MLSFRKRLNLTQNQVAARAHIANGSYNRAEKGKENMRLETIEAIAKALEIPVIELFRGNEYFSKPTKEEALQVILDALGIDLKRIRGPKKSALIAKNDTFEDPK